MPLLQDVNRTDGNDVTPGLKTIAFVALCSQIATFPNVVGATNPGDKVTIDDDIIFATGGKFYKFYTTREKGKFTQKLDGERDCRSFEYMYEFSFPGNTPEALGVINNIKNANTVWVVDDLDGNKRLLGSIDNPCEVTVAEEDSGDKFNTYKGYKITVRATGKPAPFYNGAVSLTPAT